MIFFNYLITLIAAGITYNDLKLVRKEDLQELIPPLGLRIRFREKLLIWKKEEVRFIICFFMCLYIAAKISSIYSAVWIG